MDEALLKSGQFPNVAIMAGSDPKEVMEEYGQTDTEHMDNGVSVHMCPNDAGAHSNVSKNLSDSREKLETDIMFEYLEFPGDQNRIFAYLDRQAAITERECMSRDTSERVGWDCAECAEGLGKELDARCDKLKERIAELTAERDQLSRDLDAEHALVVQFEHDNEELRDTCNTLRASVAGLKMTVERFKARESGDARQSG